MSRDKAESHIIRNVFWAIVIGLLVTIGAATIYLMHQNIPVLEPAGPIAAGEKHLMILAVSMMLVIVIPVFGMVAWFAWRYRENNHTPRTKYQPDWDHSRVAETTWWLIPGALIFILSIVTWQSSHRFDPYKALASSQRPLTIQVVALDWRWLFIYPEQQVASINQVVFPVNRPVHFEITSDAPMNSFWLPQLAGQIYAMPGMVSQLNLSADRTGTFQGRSANISGRGFSDMQFEADSLPTRAFDAWVTAADMHPTLTQDRYQQLAQASTDSHVQYFVANDPNVFTNAVNKYQSRAFVLTASEAK